MNSNLKTICQEIWRLTARLRRQPAHAPSTPDYSGYRAPEIVDVGPARELIAGATGKHTDGSTGWYWDQKGCPAPFGGKAVPERIAPAARQSSGGRDRLARPEGDEPGTTESIRRGRFHGPEASRSPSGV